MARINKLNFPYDMPSPISSKKPPDAQLSHKDSKDRLNDDILLPELTDTSQLTSL